MVKSETKSRKLWLRSTAGGMSGIILALAGSTEIRRLCWKRVMLLNPNDTQGIDNLFLQTNHSCIMSPKYKKFSDCEKACCRKV